MIDLGLPHERQSHDAPDASMTVAGGMFGSWAWQSVVMIGAFGGLMPSLQPLLLGAMRDAGRIDAAGLGRIATAEAISMGVVVTLAGIFLSTQRLKPVALFALLLGVVVNIATGQMPAAAILPLRMMAGAASGLQLWLLLGLLARISLPARVTGWYVIIQGVTALALSAAFSIWIVPLAGVGGAYAILAGLGIFTIPAILWMPGAYAPVANGTDRSSFVTARGMLGLLAAAFQLAGIMAFWVYVLPAGRALGVSSDVVQLAVSCAIAAQIVAGAGAIKLAALPARAVIVACAVASLASLTVIAFGLGNASFVIALSVFGFAWVFVISFHVPLVIELDPSRRSVMLLTGMQLFGVAAGPFATSLLIASGPARAPIATAGVFLIIAITIALATGRISRRNSGN